MKTSELIMFKMISRSDLVTQALFLAFIVIKAETHVAQNSAVKYRIPGDKDVKTTGQSSTQLKNVVCRQTLQSL
jgi:hypothetical protein